MKSEDILIICNSFPDEEDEYTGGIFVKDQLKAICKHFRNVYVISPVPVGYGLLHAREYSDYMFDNVCVFYPRYLNFPPLYFVLRRLWTRLEARAVREVIRRERASFRLIHAHYTWRSGALAATLKKELNVPVVITEHTSRTFCKAIRKRDKLFVESWNLADAIIRVRRDDICLFERVGISRDKIRYVPNGFDPLKFKMMDPRECRRILGLPEEVKLIVSVGSLTEVKGHKYLLKAMSRVLQSRRDVVCVIIGEGNLRRALGRMAARLKIESSVRLVGGKLHDEIPIWVNAADLFVLPSLSEGNPTVMFEALGCGVPFIGTRVGGIPEVITSEKLGLLCNRADSDQLANCIERALGMNWDREYIARYAAAFSWEWVAKSILEVYEQLLNQSPGRRSVMQDISGSVEHD